MNRKVQLQPEKSAKVKAFFYIKKISSYLQVALPNIFILEILAFLA